MICPHRPDSLGRGGVSVPQPDQRSAVHCPDQRTAPHPVQKVKTPNCQDVHHRRFGHHAQPESFQEEDPEAGSRRERLQVGLLQHQRLLSRVQTDTGN